MSCAARVTGNAAATGSSNGTRPRRLTSAQAERGDRLAGEQGVTPVPSPHEATARGVQPVYEPVDDLDEPDAAAGDDEGDGYVHPYGADK